VSPESRIFTYCFNPVPYIVFSIISVDIKSIRTSSIVDTSINGKQLATCFGKSCQLFENFTALFGRVTSSHPEKTV